MQRRTNVDPHGFLPKSIGSASPVLNGGRTRSHFGNRDATSGNGTFTTADDICRELDGATFHNHGEDWQIKVWGIHQTGVDSWIQISADAAAAHHDLVLHMTGEALVRDAIESIDGWLGSVLPSSHIIHVA